MSDGSAGLFLLTGDCGSLYCNGHHPVGVFTSREDAEAITVDDPALQGEPGPAYMTLKVVEMPTGRALAPEHLRYGCH